MFGLILILYLVFYFVYQPFWFRFSKNLLCFSFSFNLWFYAIPIWFVTATWTQPSGFSWYLSYIRSVCMLTCKSTWAKRFLWILSNEYYDYVYYYLVWFISFLWFCVFCFLI